MLPAWAWVNDPSLTFMFASYSDSLSTELSVLRRSLLSSDWFQRTFPQRVIFSADENMKTQYRNTAQGSMISTSMSGTVSGKGCDVLVIDDPLSAQESYSDVARESVNQIFTSTFRSRLNEPERGAIVLICQRLHEQDLPGYLLTNEPDTWTLVRIPMIAEVDEEIRFPISGRVVKRKAGDLLQPSRFSAAWCAREQAVNTFRWAGQYEQRPAPAGGAIFKSSWLQRYDQLPEKKDHVVISLDTAFSTKKSADYSVASIWIANDDGFYLAHIFRDKIEYPQLKMAIQNLASVWHPTAVLVEEKGSGQSLTQSLTQETLLPIIPVKVETDKVSRAHAVTALFESGRVFLPRFAPWLADFESELELFPFSANDDQIDSTTQALAYLREQMYEHQYPILDMNNDGTLLRIFQDSIVAGAQVVRDVWGKIVGNPRDQNLDKKALFPHECLAAGTTAQQQITQNMAGTGLWAPEKIPPCPYPDCKATCRVAINNKFHCNQCSRDTPNPACSQEVMVCGRNGPMMRTMP